MGWKRRGPGCAVQRGRSAHVAHGMEECSSRAGKSGARQAYRERGESDGWAGKGNPRIAAAESGAAQNPPRSRFPRCTFSSACSALLHLMARGHSPDHTMPRGHKNRNYPDWQKKRAQYARLYAIIAHRHPGRGGRFEKCKKCRRTGPLAERPADSHLALHARPPPSAAADRTRVARHKRKRGCTPHLTSRHTHTVSGNGSAGGERVAAKGRNECMDARMCVGWCVGWEAGFHPPPARPKSRHPFPPPSVFP